MVVPILVYFDQFLIGSLFSVAAVGFYSPPYTISVKLGILSGSLTATLFPAFSSCAARGDSEWIRNALVRSLKYVLLLIGPAALILAFFAHALLSCWLGTEFAKQGTTVLQILAVGVVSNSLALVPLSLLHGIGRPDVTAKFHLVELPIHVSMAWFMINRLGLPGAALAWTIRVTLDFLLLLVAACWLTRTPAHLLASRELRRSVAGIAVLAVGLSALWASAHGFATQAAFTFLLGGAFMVAAWHSLLTAEEKWQIRAWLRVAR
jgi:O-antigen/teichoic acid export membrane protein